MLLDHVFLSAAEAFGFSTRRPEGKTAERSIYRVD